MHCDHDTFAKAVREKRKVKMTFFINGESDIKDKIFGPVFYSTSVARDGSDCYFLWDFTSEEGSRILGLVPSQIVSMELAEEPFDIEEFLKSRREIGES